MYPSFNNISDRYRKRKTLLERLELEQQINSIQSDLYQTADWNGTSLLSLTGPTALKTPIATQTNSTAVFRPTVDTSALFNDLTQLERNRGSTPNSVISEPTTKREVDKASAKPKPKLINAFQAELFDRVANPKLRPVNQRKPSNVSMESVGTSQYATPKERAERLRLRMESEESKDSEMSSLNLNSPGSDVSNVSDAPSTATTYLQSIGFAEYDDREPIERDVSPNKAAELTKAFFDKSKASGEFADRLIKDFHPISDATNKPLTSIKWDLKAKSWKTNKKTKEVNDVKTYIELWKRIKELGGNPHELIRERNTLPKQPAEVAINISDSPVIDAMEETATGMHRKGGQTKRGRFNNLIYKTIGARKVHLPSLQKGYLSVRHMNGTMAGRKTKIDDQLLRLIKSFVFEDYIDQPLYDSLEIEDQAIFSELLRASRIQSTLKDGWKSPREALKAKYDKLMAQIDLGNDSVLPELKKVLVDMFSQGMISDKQFKSLLEHLL